MIRRLKLSLLLCLLPLTASSQYWEYETTLIPGTIARAEVVNTAFQGIETAFAQMEADFFVTLWQGDWVTGKKYLVNAFVTVGDIVYVCVEEHTSGTFATDLAAGKWEEVLTNTISDGAITTAKLADDAVTNAKLGADSVTAAEIVDASVGTAELASTSITTTKLVDNAVDNGKLRDSNATSVIGRSANTAGNPADISASANDTVLRRTSDTLSFGAVPDGALSARAHVGGFGRFNSAATTVVATGAVTGATNPSTGTYQVSLSGFSSSTSYACTVATEGSPVALVALDVYTSTSVQVEVAHWSTGSPLAAAFSIICTGD